MLCLAWVLGTALGPAAENGFSVTSPQPVLLHQWPKAIEQAGASEPSSSDTDYLGRSVTVAGS